MSAPVGYHSVVAEPDINRRGRLKTAAQAISSFKKMDQVASLHEVESKLRSGQKFDLIFVSNDYGEEEISAFVGRTNKDFADHGVAFVVILKGADDEKTLAKLMLTGVHGFLYEPYSVERLHEITELVTKVKHEAILKRKKAAAAMLVQTITKELDKLTQYLSRGFPIERAKKKFNETCNSLKQFQDDSSLGMYCDIACDVFERAMPANVKDYGGASKRVKEKMEAQIKKQFEEEMAALGEGGAGAAESSKT